MSRQTVSWMIWLEAQKDTAARWRARHKESNPFTLLEGWCVYTRYFEAHCIHRFYGYSSDR